MVPVPFRVRIARGVESGARPVWVEVNPINLLDASAPDFHIATSTTTPSAPDRVQAPRTRGPGDCFSDGEAEVNAVVADVEREILGEALADSDLNAPAVQIESKEHRRVTR